MQEICFSVVNTFGSHFTLRMNMAAAYEGHIQLILGPMFSGKSTELLRRMRRYLCAKHKCVIIKYRHDTRYSDESAFATHDRCVFFHILIDTVLYSLLVV